MALAMDWVAELSKAKAKTPARMSTMPPRIFRRVWNA